MFIGIILLRNYCFKFFEKFIKIDIFIEYLGS